MYCGYTVSGVPMAYATSFFGLVDLLAILPSYLSIMFPGTHYLLVIRILRVLRIFRVLKLAQYLRRNTHTSKPGASCQSTKNYRIFVCRADPGG